MRSKVYPSQKHDMIPNETAASCDTAKIVDNRLSVAGRRLCLVVYYILHYPLGERLELSKHMSIRDRKLVGAGKWFW